MKKYFLNAGRLVQQNNQKCQFNFAWIRKSFVIDTIVGQN
jgi:hypothetical protein